MDLDIIGILFFSDMEETTTFGTSIILGVSVGLIPGTGTTIRILGGVIRIFVVPTTVIGDGDINQSIVKTSYTGKDHEQLLDRVVIYTNTADH